jgi:hypothetical protein
MFITVTRAAEHRHQWFDVSEFGSEQISETEGRRTAIEPRGLGTGANRRPAINGRIVDVRVSNGSAVLAIEAAEGLQRVPNATRRRFADSTVIVADKRWPREDLGIYRAPAGAERQYTVLEAGWALALA